MKDVNARSITVLNDADIACPSNVEVVFYGVAMPFIYRAMWLIGAYNVYSMVANGGAGTATVRLFAEFSLDGVTWLAFNYNAGAGTGNLFTTGAIDGAKLDAGPKYAHPDEFGPLVRFNVGIVSSGAYASAARLTATVNARFF